MINQFENRDKIINKVLDAVITTDLNFNITGWNKAAEHIYGWNYEEVKGKNLHSLLKTQIINGDLDQAVEEFLKNGFWKGDAIQYDKNNKKLYISNSARIVKDDLGAPIGIVAINRDITEKYKIQQELRKSERRFKTLTRYAPIAIFQADHKGKCSFINQKWTEITGLKVEESYGLGWQKVIHPDDRNRVIKKWEETVEKKGIYSIKHRIVTIRGNLKWVKVEANPLFDDLNKIVGYIGTVSDITERIISQKRLKESEERFRLLFKNTIDVIIWVDVNTRKIIRCNKAAEKLLKRDKEDLIGSHHLSIHPPERRDKYKRGFQENVKGKKIRRRNAELYSKSGKTIPTLLTATRVSVGGKEIMQGLFHDITDIKEAEKKLKKLNQYKSDFIRRASHELKTPLIAIKGNTELLMSRYNSKLDSNVLYHLKEIMQGSERLEEIIKNLLKTANYDFNAIKPKKSKEDLIFLIKNVIKTLKSLADKRKISINLDLHNNLIVEIEKEEIYEVLSNVVVNAIKYTNRGGNILIKTELKDSDVIVSVKDSGIGFTAEEKEILFQKFGKIERYGKGMDVEIDGTGLGLYISKKIIKSHGGKIWMESEGRNKGSTFYISLPLN
jgi:PAS domain S-box-containing protein